MDVREMRERFVHMAVHLRTVQDELNYRHRDSAPDLLAAALELIDGLIARAPFLEGDRVALRDTHVIRQWGEHNPFSAPGAAGTVRKIRYHSGRFMFGIALDQDGWVDDEPPYEVHQRNGPSGNLLMVAEDDLQRWGM